MFNRIDFNNIIISSNITKNVFTKQNGKWRERNYSHHHQLIYIGKGSPFSESHEKVRNRRRMFEGGETTVAADSFTCIDTLPSMRKKKNKNKRRFSDEQIKSLESMFESETKLEPRKKLQLARELGLQPRQVAIWFQNKRARWKSKQIEHDYSILLSNYNVLASRFENLKKEKQSLLLQV